MLEAYGGDSEQQPTEDDFIQTILFKFEHLLLLDSMASPICARKNPRSAFVADPKNRAFGRRERSGAENFPVP